MRNRSSRDAADAEGGESVGAAWARRKVGNLLRELREGAEVTQEDAAAFIERHVTTLYKIENGLPGVKLRQKGDIDGLVELYSADTDTHRRLTELLALTRIKGPFTRYRDVVSPEFDLYLGLEGSATELVSYEPDLVPGLLQTEAYAAAITSLPGGDGRTRAPNEVAKRVRLRRSRQNVLTRADDPLRLDVVLSETVLRRPVGGARVLADQLDHIVTMTRLPSVSVRVVRLDAGLHLGCTTGQFIVLRFPGGDPPIAYSDGFVGDNCFNKPQEVARYDEAFADISKHALDAAASRAFIGQIKEETT